MDNTFLVSTTKIHVTDKHFTLLSDEGAGNRGQHYILSNYAVSFFSVIIYFGLTKWAIRGQC